MPWDEYPEEAQINDDDYSTEKRRKAAEQLMEEWPIKMEDMEEKGEFSRSHYQTVRDLHLGPVDDDRTFGEIKTDHGQVRDWMEKREREGEEVDISEYLPDDLSSDAEKYFRLGWSMRQQAIQDSRRLTE